MCIIAFCCHAVLAARSAEVCAVLGVGRKHTQVSARAKIEAKNAFRIVISFCRVISTMHAVRLARFVDSMVWIRIGTIILSGLGRFPPPPIRGGVEIDHFLLKAHPDVPMPNQVGQDIEDCDGAQNIGAA